MNLQRLILSFRVLIRDVFTHASDEFTFQGVKNTRIQMGNLEGLTVPLMCVCILVKPKT